MNKTKKLLSIILVLALTISLIPTAVQAADNTGDFILYYNNTNTKWDNVYIYAWNSSSTVTAGWPGNQMSPVEGDDGIFYYQLPAGTENVIFNNGSGTQSADIIVSGITGNMYDHSDASWSTYESDITVCTHQVHNTDGNCTACGKAVDHTYVSGSCSVCGKAKPADMTLFYDNSSSNWSTVYIYTWDANNKQYSGAWPGSAMTNEGEGIWSYTFESGATNVIFNNGTAQTSDLTIPGNSYLFDGSEWIVHNTCDHSYTSSVTTAPTCTATGIRTYTCTLCGDSYTEVVAAAGHTYENGVCTGCGEAKPCDHTWNEGTVTTPAGCTSTGIKTLTCTLCGETTTEVIPAIGHIFVGGTCTGCGVPENCTDHVWDEGQVIQANTCWVAGSALYTCTVCGVTETRTLPSGHKFYSEITKAPTCTATGTETVKCYNCKYSLNKTLPKIDHSYVAGATVAPTCTADGYTVYTCSVCSATANQDLVDRTGHSFSGSTCASCGLTCTHNYVDGICSNCSDGGPEYRNGYFEIADAAQLYWFAGQVNGGNNAINGKLIADIDLKNGSWTSMGYYCRGGDANQSLGYSGTFDGQGHTVSNFTTVGTDNEGLFGYCSSATIMNLGIINANVTGWRAGAVAGYALTSTVSNCFAKDCTITGSTQNAIALQSGTVYIAPVTGPQGGVLKNSYAINCTLVDATDLAVSTHPVGGNDCQNGYYYNVTAPAAFTSLWNATEVTAAQLASGEATYLLNKGVTDGTQAWYQTCGTGLPAFSGQTVYQVGGCSGNVAYSNDPNAQAGHSYTSSVTTAPGCLTNGIRSYTCSGCGDSYTEVIPATGHSFAGGSCTECGSPDPDYNAPASVTLSARYPGLAFKDEIYYNVYFSVDNPDNVQILEMGLITWTSPVDGDITNAQYVCPGAVEDSDLWKTRSQAIAAKNMGEELYFKVYAKLADGTYVYSDMRNYSAKSYCESKLATSSDAALKSLCVALMNYGAAAQEYFGYKTDDLMNADLTPEQQAFAAPYSDAMIPDRLLPGEKGSALAWTGGYSVMLPNVTFGGALAINYSFTPSETVDGDMKLYVWTAADYDAADPLTLDSASQVITMTESDGAYIGTVSGIAAKNAGDTYFVCGVYESNGVTYRTGILHYSVATYCKNYANNSSSSFQPMASTAAVYTYYAAAYLN